jgi:hypothetical protein
MNLITFVAIVYGGITVYDMIAHGRAPLAAACWPFLTASKILAWIAMQDPTLQSETDEIEARLKALENQLNPPPTPTPPATGS